MAKAGDLITVDQYASFDFTFEWRIARNGNSGVFFHVAEAADLPSTFTTGPEYQLLDNDGHPDAKNGPDRLRRGNYALHPPPTLPETNRRMEPVAHPRQGTTRRALAQRQKVVEYELWSADWKARVEKSKFKTMPRYGLEKTGHIALQDHGDEVAFRNVEDQGA